MSIEVPLDELAGEIERWSFCYLLTVSADERPHLLALHPELIIADATLVLRFDAGTGRAVRNARERPAVSLVFPPVGRDDGMSLVVDGQASIADASHPFVDVVPTWAVLHRAAP